MERRTVEWDVEVGEFLLENVSMFVVEWADEEKVLDILKTCSTNTRGVRS